MLAEAGFTEAAAPKRLIIFRTNPMSSETGGLKTSLEHDVMHVFRMSLTQNTKTYLTLPCNDCTRVGNGLEYARHMALSKDRRRLFRR